jgi:ribosomal protein S18 acetylase RimI-like enzyme
VVRYLLNRLPEPRRIEYLPSWFAAMSRACTLNDGHLVGASGFSTTAIVMPPRRKIDNWKTMLPAGFLPVCAKAGPRGSWVSDRNDAMLPLWGAHPNPGLHTRLTEPPLPGCRQRMAVELSARMDPIKKKATAAHPDYYYFLFIGTRPAARGQGQASAMLRHYQARAAREGVAIWLESTTTQSRELYLRLGFQDCGVILLGKGRCDAQGFPKKNGEGVRQWGMLWTPPKSAPETTPAAQPSAEPTTKAAPAVEAPVVEVA